jgi:F-type H+-transporting ATPase subunit gamma
MFSSSFTPILTQSRGMATLKDLRIRLRAVKNIQKITKSMKMIAAVKYNKAERELKLVRPFGVGAQSFYKSLDMSKNFAPGSALFDSGNTQKQIVVACSSDRGLCGAIHSSVVKQIRNSLNANPSEAERTSLLLVGDKSRSQLARTHVKNIAFHFSEVGRKPVTFGDAANVALVLLQAGFEQNNRPATLYFNTFRSVVSYRTTSQQLWPRSLVARAPTFGAYDGVDSYVLESYTEFQLAAQLFSALKEGSASEWSSRMTAMDNATKNAGEMIGRLTMSMNRTRQAVITRELIEIISGAAATKQQA